MDGTLGSQTAWMLDGSGVQITSGEELAEIVRAGAEAGWPVAVHAIGDRANREALDAFERTRDVWQPLGLRQRIEHAQCLAPEDLPRFGELGVAVSVQFTHAPSDRDLAERFWGDRLEGTYAFRSLLDSGALVANGSDAPIEELDPWAGVVAGVLRTLDDRPAWRPEQALTARAGAARDVRRARRGSRTTSASAARCVPGRLADLVVLDRDPFACEPDELREVQVVATMVGRPLGAQPAALGLACLAAPELIESPVRFRTTEARWQRQAHHGFEHLREHCDAGCRRCSSSRSRTWPPGRPSRTRSTSRVP